MLPRDRVLAALEFRPPDIVPIEYASSPAGLHEHGQALKDLWARFPQDFGDLSGVPVLHPEPRWVDADGRYCELRRDEWGVLWEHRIFGVAGHPVERPLDDWAALDGYEPPPAPACHGAGIERERTRAERHMGRHFLKSGWISIIEVMHAVRRFEDVLMDVSAGGTEINRLADMIVERQAGVVRYLLARGVDGVQFADDYGTQTGLLVSPETWRRFFLPRWKRLIAPVRAAGKKVFFHSCGNVRDLLEDFAEMGVDAVWPQLPLYDEASLAARCRELGLAVVLHPDRGDLMVRARPEDVRAAVRRLADAFAVGEGGMWFYVEIDHGFPSANVRALIETIAELRGAT